MDREKSHVCKNKHTQKDSPNHIFIDPANKAFFIRKRRTLNGAGNEIRTRDSKLGKLALYQLSYARLPNVAVYDSLWLMSIVFEYWSHFNEWAFRKIQTETI